MKKHAYIVLFIAVSLCGCQTYSLAIDDAYHWEQKETSVTATSTTNSPDGSTAAPPIIEYIHTADTTVTIRVKR